MHQQGKGEAGESPPADLMQALRDLESLDRESLRAEWRRLFRAAAPVSFSRDVLQRDIAYRLQELVLGGLPRSVARQLTQATDPETTERKKNIAGKQRLRQGVTLVREWHGTTHTVLVVDGGFEHRGRRYGSLTQIARQITGAAWSGPRFFGLQRAAAASSPPAKGARGLRG